jgi:hypothetical protein
MSDAADYRRRSDALLHKATKVEDLGERSRLINQAIYFNELAVEAQLAACRERQAASTVIPFEDEPAGPDDYGP